MMDEGKIVKGNKYMRTGFIKESSFGILGNKIRTEIIRILHKKPLYPMEIAKILGMHEQKVYYHLKQLLNGGFIIEKDRKEVRGTIAKRYYAPTISFSAIFEEEWEEYRKEDAPEDIKWFFRPFIKNGTFNGKIIIGSPDPHGRYKAYARDGHYSNELSLLIGNLAKLPKNFVVELDVDAKLDENLIIIGGPVTNTASFKLNDVLKVRFKEDPWRLESTKTGKRYQNDVIGLISRIKSPFSEGKWILMIAGIRAIGTKSGILAITKDRSAVRMAYNAKLEEFNIVVHGYDIDGDGKIESIEIEEMA